MPKIVFVNDGRAAVVPEGTTVLDAALGLGVQISTICGGNASCSTCRVEVVAGPESLTPINPQEIAYELGEGRRLGCQARILGDVAVRVLTIPKADLS